MRARTLAVGAVPLLWLGLATVFATAAGRFFPYDPDFYYLLSALDLAEWRSIGMFHHPGTTTEILGALIIRLAQAFSQDDGGVQAAVLSDPEYYLALINAVSALVIAGGLLALGLSARRTTQSVRLAVWLQLSVFLAPVAITETASRFKAEPFLLLASVMFIAVTVAFLRGPEVSGRRFALGFAAVCGFGLATKFTFVSVAIAPLIMLGDRRSRLWFVGGTMVATIIGTLPIADSYLKFATWMYDVSSHTGIYGGGEPGVVDVASYRAGFATLFARNPAFDVVVIGGLLVLLAVASTTRGRRLLATDRECRALAAMVVSQVVGFLLAAKHGTFPTNRYLLASSCLLGLTLWLTLAVLRKREIAWPGAARWAAAVVLGLAVVAAVTGTPGSIVRHIAGLRVDERSYRENQLQLSVLDGWQFRDYARIYDFANARPVLGMFQASYYSVAQVDALARVYPRVFFCAADCSVEDWAAKSYLGLSHTKSFSAQEIAASSGGRVVLIYGTPPRLHVVGEQTTP
jgi:hypothetical protein